MANFNKVILIGRLTSDPELKQTPSGATVTSFSVAVDRRIGAGEEKKTDFVNAVAWRDRAEFICKHFKKGSHILIEGELQTRTWTDAQGVKRYATEVIVSSSGFVDAKPRDDASTPSQSSSSESASAPIVPKNNAADDQDLPF